jgi:hypothetical protein
MHAKTKDKEVTLKNVLSLFAALLMLVIPVSALAQQAAPAPSASSGLSTPAGMSEEDANAAREDLQALARAMGADVPTPPAQKKPADAPPPKKTVADVADKALDMVSGFVTRISQNLEKVAPQVWRIMIRQQYAKAFADVVVPITILILLFVIKWKLRKAWPKGSWEDNGKDEPGENIRALVVIVLPWILISLFGIWLGNRVADSIKYLVNPEYYAVRDLLSLLLNPSNAQ